MQKNRIILFSVFMVVATALLICGVWFPYNFYLAIILSSALAIVVLALAFFDPHMDKRLRIGLYVIGASFAVITLVGLIATEKNISLPTYCLLFAILEVICGAAKIIEAVLVLKEGNKMGIAFIADAIFETVLGLLMVIEKHQTLRTHIILISIDLYFEGIVKFINEMVEVKKGIQKK